MCKHTTCVPGTCGHRRTASEPQKLALCLPLSRCVVLGCIMNLLEEQPVFITTDMLISPVPADEFFIFALLGRIISKFTNKDSILLTSWSLITYFNVLDLKKIWVMSKIISYCPYIYVRFSGKQVMGIVSIHRCFFFMSEKNVTLKLPWHMCRAETHRLASPDCWIHWPIRHVFILTGPSGACRWSSAG